MRLNDFTNKRSSRKTAATRQPIVVQNDAKVQQLQKHIEDLEQQLSTNIGLEDERDSAIRRKNSVEEGHSALSTENEQLTQQVMNAESLKPSMEKNSEREDKDAFKIIALGLTALAFAYATRG